MNIKKSILEKIKKSAAPPFLFVGSGLSQRYLGTPTWVGLLKHFSSIINDEELAYEMYADEASRIKCSNGIEPKIAELLESDFNKQWFRSSVFYENRKNLSELVKQGCSPLKLEIANYFINASEQNFIPGTEKEIELLKQVGDRSLAGVITTNYDTLMERLFARYKYNTLIGQDQLIFSPLTGISEIYKIHGCCTDPKSIIINNRDYESFNERNAYLVAKLLTIFLEHPIIFIGYKIGDTNIREILSSIAKCMPAEKLQLLKDRFIFIEWNNTENEDSISNYEFSNLSDNKSIVMTKVCVKDFSCIYEALLENKVTYNPRLIKKIKEDIYNVVLTSEPSKTLKVLVDIDDDRLDEVEAVVGFGVMQQLGYKGYDSILPEDLFEDVIFDDKKYDNVLIVEKSLPLILKYNQSIPIFKYLANYQRLIPDKIKKYSERKYSDFLSKGMKRIIKKDGNIKKTISELRDEYGMEASLKMIVFIDEQYLNVDELYQYIMDMLKAYPNLIRDANCMEKTEIRRLIKIYDYIKYKKKAKLKPSK